MIRPATLLILSLAIYFYYFLLCDAVSISLRPKILRTDFSTLPSDDEVRAPGDAVQKCGETRARLKDGDHGFIESPNYPNKYPAGADCEWDLRAEPGVSIHSTVFDLRTYSDPIADITDSVYISLVGQWNDTQRYSGDLTALTPFPLISEGNQLLVKFKSSIRGGNQRGFRLGYFVTRGQKPAATEPANQVLAVSCNYIPISTPAVFPDGGQSRATCEEHAGQLKALKRENPNPFLVALVLDESQFCSGTLISRYHVLTSAHCTHQVERIELLFGTTNLNTNDIGVQKRTVKAAAVTAHPLFNPKTGANDISIITLTEPVIYTRFVQAARLPAWNLLSQGLAGFDVELSGWGEHNGSIISDSSSKKLQLAPNIACRTSLHKGLNGMMMCARPHEELCTADSGSPVTTRCKDNTQGITNEEVR